MYIQTGVGSISRNSNWHFIFYPTSPQPWRTYRKRRKKQRAGAGARFFLIRVKIPPIAISTIGRIRPGDAATRYACPIPQSARFSTR